MNRKYVSKLDDLKATAKYIVLLEKSMQYDSGYGHRGSPDYSTLNYLEVISFDTDEDLRAWIFEHEANHNRKAYKVLSFKEVEIIKEVNLHIKS